MAKAEKKAFAWDHVEGIGMYTASEKEQHTVEICTLNGTLYVADTKLVMKKDTGWTPVKNTCIRLDNFDKLADIVSEWKLNKAFGGSEIIVGEKPAKKKAEKKASEAGTLKGKKADPKAEPKAEKKPRAKKAK